MMSAFTRRLTLPAIVLCALAACGRDAATNPDARVPAGGPAEVTAPTGTYTLVIHAGEGQKANAGTALRIGLTLQAVNAAGAPVAGVPVAWTVSSGGGKVTPVEAATNAYGAIHASWTMGPYGGPATLTATSPGGSVVVHATSVGAAPVLAPAGGNTQAAAAGSMLPAPVVLKAVNAAGAPLAGVPVSWTVASGGGSLTPMAAVTGADGTVAAQWKLGTAAGTQSAMAKGAAGGQVAFTATAMASLTALGASGSGQSGTVGTTLPQPLVVRVTNGAGAAVPGVTVQFTATGGSVSPSAAVTGADGTASTRWTLGATVGTQAVTARVAGAPNVGFIATATAPLPVVTLVKTSGDNQVALPGHNVPQGISVRAVDPNGNGVANVPLTFTASDGGSVSSPRPVTDTGGYAVASWVLGPNPGTQTLTVSGGGASVTFTALASAGGDVGSINFSVGRVWLDIGETTQLYASANPIDGRPVTSGATLSFTTDRPDLLQITSVSLRDPLHGYVYIKALGAGEPTLIVTAGSVTKTLTYRFFVPGTRPGTRPGDGGGGGSADRAPVPAP